MENGRSNIDEYLGRSFEPAWMDANELGVRNVVVNNRFVSDSVLAYDQRRAGSHSHIVQASGDPTQSKKIYTRYETRFFDADADGPSEE